MKTSGKFQQLLSFVILLVLTCCQGKPSTSILSDESKLTRNSSYEAPTPSETKQPMVSNESSPSKTPSTTSEAPNRESTELPIALTYTAFPTVSNPTPIKIDPQDEFLLDIQNKGYSLYYGSSTTGPGGYTYSAFIFLDTTFSDTPPREDISAFPPFSFRHRPETNGCILAFYRSDGQHNELIHTFDAPLYAEGSWYDGYPVFCHPNDWNQSSTYYSYYPLEPDFYDLLDLNGVWSDINQNGLPEFSVHYQYCPGACLNHGAVAIHIYEIQTTSRVIDLTAGLPGVIEPFNLVHSVDPITFYVYDPTLWYCYKWCTINTWWIYAWDEEGLVDVTDSYVDEYLELGEQIKADFKRDYGRIFREWTLLSVLFLYEKAGLSDLALETFLDISDPGFWPEASDMEYCWLQYARAQAQIDRYEGRPFRFPEFRLIDETVYSLEILSRVVPGLVQSGYDLSACEQVLTTQSAP